MLVPRRAAASFLAAVLLLVPLAACDNEDVQDVREGGENVEKGIDNIDNDGKDD